MNARFFAVSAIALASFVSAVSPAAAQTAPVAAGTGHYEWRVAPSYGPKAPIRAPIRVWVGPQSPAAADLAACDCSMMQHGDSGMKAMPSTPSDTQGRG